jgi:hypothetical protein
MRKRRRKRRIIAEKSLMIVVLGLTSGDIDSGIALAVLHLIGKNIKLVDDSELIYSSDLRINSLRFTHAFGVGLELSFCSVTSQCTLS